MPDDSPLTRVIVINGQSILDVIKSEVEEEKGDPILRQRVDALLARDCARRKLCAILLPALDHRGRTALAVEVKSWRDPIVRDAAREILDHAWEHRDGRD